MDISQGEFQEPTSESAGKKKLVVIVGGLLLIGIFFFLVFFLLTTQFKTKITQNPQETPTPTTLPTPIIMPDTNGVAIVLDKTKLMDTKYKHFSHEIFPGSISSTSAEVIKGYTIETVPQSDGSVKITATPSVSGYGPIEVIVKNGQKAYFVIGSPISTSDPKTLDLADNFIVIVDQEGRITRN